MPATRSRRVRGIMPIGDSVPCGVSSDTRRRCDAELGRQILAEQDAVRLLVGRRVQRVEAAALHRADLRSVTSGSSAGSMPLIWTGTVSWAAEISALTEIAGAAPMTCGSWRSLSASA